ncbi:glutamine amidotransferase [bacterium]|nr:glutamine amidotransferase [bacterium]
MTELVLAHLYPAEMNIYGDTGNVIVLRKRAEWRGIGMRIDPVGVGDTYDFTSADIVFSGGGQDRSQEDVADDLQRRSDDIHAAVADGTVFLTVCGTYQLFGRRFVTHDHTEMPGIGVFAAETVAGDVRMIGNIVVESEWGRLVGFENHSGRTFLDEGQQHLGSVVKGYGNNERREGEGAVTANAFGTYLHGSLLPKNPALADEMLGRALARRGLDARLESLDDSSEQRAAAAAADRP